ncbi:MAG: threonine synthase [Calditrichaeota bacterium]|nr:MAG: threonine synthase [Calditrichota bacterium]
MSHIVHLQCVSCEKTYPRDGGVEYTCPDCGPLHGTLEVIYDYDLIRRELTPTKLKQNTNYTHWRYLPLLPIEKPELILPLAVGWTPVYRNSKLAEEWGIKELFVKDDTRNPSASLKDRASSVAVVKALEKQVPVVTAASTGNAASSWALFTALTDMQTIIFVPETAPRAKVAQLLLFGATVIQVKGTYDEAFDLCTQAAEKWGWYNRSTAINPYLGEGKKTAALEICEQLEWKAPDYVFVSVGDGCIFQGMWKGFKELYQLGLIEKLPRMMGVQAEGSAPLVQAWEEGREECRPLQPRTLADSISVGMPRDQIKALRAVRESDGQFIAVSDEAILEAIRILAREVGIMAEPAGAAAMAGLKKSIAEGILPSDARVMVMVTGHGLKDIDGVMQAVTHQPVTVHNDLSDVQEKLEPFLS